MAYKNPKPEEGDQKQSLQSSFAIVGDLFNTAATPGIGERVGSPLTKPTVNNPVEFVEAGAIANALDDWKYVLPGLAEVKWAPTFGTSGGINSFLNKASMRVYREIQDALKNRNLHFAHTDVMIHVQAYDSVLMAYLFAVRGYQCMEKENKFSKYFPRAFAKACGIDYDSWFANRPMIVEYLKTWRRDLLSYPMPKVFHALSCHYEMMRRVYLDADSSKAQVYVCTPDSFWHYEKVDTLGGLTRKSLPDAITWDAFKQCMEEMLTAIKNSTDFDVISAALRTTYGDTDALDVIPYDQDMLEAVRDPYFLSTLTNALVLPDPTMELKDTGHNFLMSSISGAVLKPVVKYPDIFNTLTDMPSAPEMVNYARWHPSIAVSTRAYVVVSCGTEIITDFVVIFAPNDGLTISKPYAVKASDGTVTNKVLNMSKISYQLWDDVSAYDVALNLSVFSAFKWHPTLWYRFQYVMQATNGSTTTCESMLPFTQWNFEFEYTGDNLTSAHNAWLDAAYGSGVGGQPAAPESEKK